VEVSVAFCYQTGRLEHAPHTWWRVVLWPYLGIVIRDIHFYFAHRFMHQKFLYSFVHSVHHRNVDIEPFAGDSFCLLYMLSSHRTIRTVHAHFGTSVVFFLCAHSTAAGCSRVCVLLGGNPRSLVSGSVAQRVRRSLARRFVSLHSSLCFQLQLRRRQHSVGRLVRHAAQKARQGRGL
jgi:hypothetical protein